MVGNYRPITCSTVINKIISKVLANRLKLRAAWYYKWRSIYLYPGKACRGQCSTGFWVGETLWKIRDFPYMCYQSWSKKCQWLGWLAILEAVNAWPWVSPPVCKLDLFCISTVSYNILFNEKSLHPFEAKRARGTPSPDLFIIVMEYLSSILLTLAEAPNFNYQPKCTKFSLTHLTFADDLLLFARGDSISVKMLLECFNDFAKVSGMSANSDKPEVFLGGMKSHEQKQILNSIRIHKGTLPSKANGEPFFGLPVGAYPLPHQLSLQFFASQSSLSPMEGSQLSLTK